jgi:glycosyltransferase involved in cell wall biosynthesis
VTRVTQNLLVSIIVNNYNYGRFVGATIESALNQTYPRTEIIVVDDGSTDDSRDVIARYGDRVTTLFKPNAGQASAFNAGFVKSHGDIIIFLDSDDLLAPHIVEAVVAEFHHNPRLAKVQYPLAVIDAHGQATGARVPPAQLPLPSGDLRQQMLTFPDDVRSSPTSGNAFAASVLREILPMPVLNPGYAWADLYLYNLAPLFGPIKSLATPGGCYRVHESNHYFSPHLDLGRIRQMMLSTRDNRQHIVKFARRLGLPNVPPRAEDILSVTYMVNRVASLRLDPPTHPIVSDSRLRLARLGLRASKLRYDVPLRVRVAYMAWFVAAVYSPRPVTRWLVTQVFYPQKRGPLARVVS